jgi:hypothetical protein
LPAIIITSFLFIKCAPIKNVEAIIEKNNQEYPDRNINEKLSTIEMSEDIDILLKTIDDVHPNPYQVVSKKDFQNKINQLKTNTDSITIKDFYLKLAPVVISLGGDHSYISLPWQGFNKHRFKNGGKIFPLDVDVQDNKLVVSGNLTPVNEIKPGDEIQSINGIKSDIIMNNFLRYCHGSTSYIKVHKRLTDPNYFPHLLWLVYNFSDNYILEINDKTFEIDGLSQNDIHKARQSKYKKQPNHAEFSYNKIQNGTGLLVITNFWQNEFEEKLKNAFISIKNDSIKNLVIDVRNNTGGSTMKVEQLINYIYDEPYRTASFTEQRRSRQEDAFFKQIFAWWFKPLTRIVPPLSKYYRTPIGENVKINMKEKKPKRNPYRFKGNIYVLSGPVNYSAGTEFVAVIKDYNIGAIIGQTTGGPANGDGNANEFSLPNSHLRVSCATNFQIRPNGKLTAGGIKPDIEVPVSSAEKNLKDGVFEKAIEIIEESKK